MYVRRDTGCVFALHLSLFVVVSVWIFSHEFPEDISCVLVRGNDVWSLTFVISERHIFPIILTCTALVISGGAYHCLKKNIFPTCRLDLTRHLVEA